jgi:hypothetical protein
VDRSAAAKLAGDYGHITGALPDEAAGRLAVNDDMLRRLLGPGQPVGAAALHICARCRDDFVTPTRWEAEVNGLWRVHLRCGACGHERDTVVGPQAARMFDRALAKRSEVLERVERERMTHWVDAFSIALERDLIDASDF